MEFELPSPSVMHCRLFAGTFYFTRILPLSTSSERLPETIRSSREAPSTAGPTGADASGGRRPRRRRRLTEGKLSLPSDQAELVAVRVGDYGQIITRLDEVPQRPTP